MLPPVSAPTNVAVNATTLSNQQPFDAIAFMQQVSANMIAAQQFQSIVVESRANKCRKSETTKFNCAPSCLRQRQLLDAWNFQKPSNSVLNSGNEEHSGTANFDLSNLDSEYPYNGFLQYFQGNG